MIDATVVQLRTLLIWTLNWNISSYAQLIASLSLTQPTEYKLAPLKTGCHRDTAEMLMEMKRIDLLARVLGYLAPVRTAHSTGGKRMCHVSMKSSA